MALSSRGFASWAVFLACLAAYVVGLAPGPYWLDSSELAASAFVLGVAHPPGHPLPMLVGKLVALLPVGAVAFRVALASALAGAGAAALTTRIAGTLCLRLMVARARGSSGGDGTPLGSDGKSLGSDGNPLSSDGKSLSSDGKSLSSDGKSLGSDGKALGSDGKALGSDGKALDSDGRRAAWCGAAAGLLFGLSYGAAFSSVRAEVYALHALLVLAALDALLDWDVSARARDLARAALWAGLALCDHTLLAGLFAVAAATFALGRRRPRLRPLLWAAGAVLVAVSAYLYLPLRAARHPAVDWGAPTTLARFLWTVSAAAFQKSLAHASSSATPDVVFAIARELGPSSLLAIVGAYAGVRLRALRAPTLLLVGAALLTAASVAMVGFDPDNPDAHGYLAVAVALGAVLAAVGAAAILSVLPSPRATLALAVGLVLLALAWQLPSSSRWRRARFDDTERCARAILDGAPPRAVLVSSYFQTVFALWYARTVEGRRPDVDHVHRHFLAYPGYAEELVRRRPSLRALLDAHDVVPSVLASRPHLLEFDVDEGAALAALASVPALPALDEDEPQSRRVALWSDYLAALSACRRGDRARAGVSIDHARALLLRTSGAVDAELEALAARCLAIPHT